MDGLLISKITVHASSWLLTADIPKAIIIHLEALNEVLEDAFCFNHMNSPIEMTENHVLHVKGRKPALLQVFFFP